MINKEEVLYGKLAVMSGFIDEDQFRQAVEEKRGHVEKANASGNGQPATIPALDRILRNLGMIDSEQHAFIREKLAVRTPKTLAGYEIVKKLGQGAMGAVYKARQVAMDRMVALKVLSRDLKKNKTFVARFEREAKIVGKLNHRNIVAGIDRGIENGIYYYVMEYVEGRSLDDILETDGKLPREQALDYALQMARALEHAHSHGCVHRDVKPENILISNEGVAKLCDMGLAKPEDDNANLTQVGTSMGTPHYISPEQARGREADIRSDIYSLGASLWLMLFGDVPFRAETPALVLAKHVDAPLPNPRELDPDLPNSVCRLLKKMLAKEPEDRQTDPSILILELEAIIEGRADESSGRSGRRKSAKGGARKGKKGKTGQKGKSPKSGKSTKGQRSPKGGANPKSANRPSGVVRSARPARGARKSGPSPALIGGVVVAVIAVIALAFAFSGGGGDETGEVEHVDKKPVKTAKTPETDQNAPRLARLDTQLADIAKLAVDPQAFQAAIARYDALREQYTDLKPAVERIDRARDRVVTRAEDASRKARMEMDADITRFLGAGRKGDAFDLLATFPSYLEFTKAGQEVVSERKKLDEELADALTALLKATGERAAEGKIDEAIKALSDAKPTFDATRRETIAATLGELERARGKAHSAEVVRLAGDHEKLAKTLRSAIARRAYGEGKNALAPLVARLDALPEALRADDALGPLRDSRWDLDRLVKLEAAYGADGGSATPADYLAKVTELKDQFGKAWPLFVALWQFHEKRYLAASEPLERAKAAEVDCGTLPARLATKLPGALEAAAAAAFAELEKQHAAKDWDGLEMGIQAFTSAFAKSELYAEKKPTLDGWIAEIAAARAKKDPKKDPKKTPLDQLLNGKVHKWDPETRRLDIEYYFKTDKELKDWKLADLGGQLSRWMTAKMALDTKVKGWVTGIAPAGYDHCIVWERTGGLVVSARYRSTDPLISGIALMADGATKRYAFGFKMENPFGNFGGRGGRGGRGGGAFPRHKAYIAKYDGDWRNPSFLHTFGQSPKENTVYSIVVEARDKKKGNALSMTLNKRRVMAAKDGALTKGRVALFAFRNASFARVRMKGTVDAAWLDTFIKSNGSNSGFQAGGRDGGGRGSGNQGRRGGNDDEDDDEDDDDAK